MKKKALYAVSTLVCVMLLSFSFGAFSLQAQQAKAPETAAEIMAAAKQKAIAEHKNILVLFHASWCGWCKKLEASIMDKTCKDYFERNFIITYLDVLETGSNVGLENPGARELLDQYGGAESGIPYWLILSPDGKLLTNSKIHSQGSSDLEEGQNLGCPATAKEVDYFVALLKQYSNMTDKEAVAIRTRFLKNAPNKTN